MAEHIKMGGSEFLARIFIRLHHHKAIMLSVAKAQTPYAEQKVSIPS
jgi:hypothetical protein